MKNEDFRKYYEINKGRIGEGWLSVVYKAKNKKTNEKKAIKVLNINKLRYNFNKCNLRDANDNDVKSFINDFIKETENMKLIEGENKDNKNTVKFDECFMTDKELSIVMELCDDNLMNFLIERKTSFNSNEIYGILSQLNNTFQLLVKKKLVHRDLKLENILVKYENKEKTKYILKLSDYEVTKKLRTFTEKCTKRVGTLKYMAPEILQGHEYGRECDLWSLGIIGTLAFILSDPALFKRNLRLFKNLS